MNFFVRVCVKHIKIHKCIFSPTQKLQFICHSYAFGPYLNDCFLHEPLKLCCQCAPFYNLGYENFTSEQNYVIKYF